MSVLPHGKMDRTVSHPDWPPRDGAASWLLAPEIIHLQASANYIINNYYETFEFFFKYLRSSGRIRIRHDSVVAKRDNPRNSPLQKKKTVSHRQLSALDSINFWDPRIRSDDWSSSRANTHIYLQALGRLAKARMHIMAPSHMRILASAGLQAYWTSIVCAYASATHDISLQPHNPFSTVIKSCQI